MTTQYIENRYNELADTNASLSCGNSLIFAEAAEGEFCIDLGSGKGRDAIQLGHIVGRDGFVLGLDTSDKMIVTAKQAAFKAGLYNVRFAKSEISNIPVNDNTVDLVLSNCALNHVTDKLATWTEIFRVLKSGGRFVISDIYSLEPIPEEWSSNPEMVAQCWAGAQTRQVYMDTIKQAGFSTFEVLTESKPYEKNGVLLCSFTIKGFKL